VETKRPSSYPAYRHDDLQRSFAPVVADVRKYLASGAVPNAIPIPLVEGRGGARRGLITFERSLLRTASFVLTVQADMPAQDLQRRFPSHVTIAAVEQMKDFVTSALPGIPVRVLPVAPRQIPFYGGASYFELERNSPHWQAMHNSAAFGIFVSGDFPNLRLELWAIKGS